VVPGRIDILTELTGLTFEEAWPGRLRRPFGEIDVDFIGRAEFIRNKRATGRPRISATSKEWTKSRPTSLPIRPLCQR
jgi:hypothetical protein